MCYHKCSNRLGATQPIAFESYYAAGYSTRPRHICGNGANGGWTDVCCWIKTSLVTVGVSRASGGRKSRVGRA